MRVNEQLELASSTFSLLGIVLHQGKTPHSGHYVAVAKHGDSAGPFFVYDDAAVRILEQHQVKVVDQIAYFDRAQVMEYLAKAPSQFVWSGRNPAHDVVVGGDHVIFAPVAGPPFVRALDRGRSPL